MHRRTFVGAMGGLGLAAAAGDKRTAIYHVEHFKLKSGTQLPRMHDFISQSFLPVMSRVHSGPLIYLEAIVAPQLPHLTVIMGFSSIEEMSSVHNKLLADESIRKAFMAWDNGPEPAYDSLDSSLVEAADYSPEIKSEPSNPPRIFELRVYHSPTRHQLAALHDRFRGPEIKIFHRSGIHPILYGSTMFGPNLPNLTYLIPFADLAAREKAWAAFGSDPEWQKVRQDSVSKSGEIVSDIQVSLYKATAYSPVR